MRVGDSIRIEVLKSGGHLYRWYPAIVERLMPGVIVTFNPPGHIVYNRDREWVSRWGIRGVYWLDRPYSLLEVYYPNGVLHELYAHVASPPTVNGGVVSWFDYELDVILKPDGRLLLVDEDEFAEAAVEYGYTPEFQAACYRIAADIAAFLPTWGSAPR